MTRRKGAGRRAPAELGTVEQLPSGRWRAFYRREGRKFTAPHTFPTKAEGRSWLATETADRARGTWKDPRDAEITLASFAHEWLAGRPDLRPRTQDLYSRLLTRWIVPTLGDVAVSKISPSTVRAWYALIHASAAESASRQGHRNRPHPARVWAASAGLAVAASGRISPTILSAWAAAGSPTPEAAEPTSPARGSGQTTAAQAYRLLRTVLGAAVADGLVDSNPCRLKGAGVVSHRERETATLAELDRLAAAMPARLAAAVHVAAWSGLRYGELFGLARSHVSPDGRVVHVRRALENVPGMPVRFGRTKTQDSIRTVHLPGHIARRLIEHIAAAGEDGDPSALVFSMPDGSPVPNVYLSRVFRAARSAVGREGLTWHDLRHTGATLAYAAGASVPDVQRRLGHRTMRAAQLYAHSAQDADRLLAERLETLTIDSSREASDQ